jgi:protein tyrosine phosphatase
MAFIQNVSYTNFAGGAHRHPGKQAVAIQILSKDRVDFRIESNLLGFPVSPYEFIETHKFLIDDTSDPHCIDDKDVERISDILKESLDLDRNVIVHCAAGVSRSGAVCEVGTIIGFEDTWAFRMPNVVIKNKLLNHIMGNGYE